MISSQQLKQVLTYSFTNGISFVGPAGTFIASPSVYTNLVLPGSVTLTGSIIPNDAVNITWSITNSIGTLLLSGTGNTSSYTLPVVPSTTGVNVYYWNINYQNNSGANLSLILNATVTVTSSSLVGQLNGAGVNIVIPADLTAPIEATLTTTSQLAMINLFAITAVYTGRLVIVIPDDYGTVVDIQDNTDSTVLSQFNLVVDAPNNRKIYVGINAVTPATYNYKIVF
jgi:hypothetical protein